MKFIILLLAFLILTKESQSDCKGKVTFSEGNAKILKPVENTVIEAEFTYDYENPSIAGSVFKAKSNLKFYLPKVDVIIKENLNIEKVVAAFNSPPEKCTYKVTKYPVNVTNKISIRTTEENQLTFRGDFSLFVEFEVKCNDDPPVISTGIGGGQPGGLMSVAIHPGATTTVCNDGRINFGETKWCSTVKLLSVTNINLTPENANQGDIVEEGDVIETGDDGNIEITFPDRSYIRIGPNSRVSVSSLKCKGDQRDEYRIVVNPGTIWSKVSTVLGGKAKFEVRGQNATYGVRGTEFIAESINDTIFKTNSANKDLKDYIFDQKSNSYIRTTSNLYVIEGKVEFYRNEGELAELQQDMQEVNKDLDEEIKSLETEEVDENEAADNEMTKSMLKGLKSNLEKNKIYDKNAKKGKTYLVQKGYKSTIIGKSDPTEPVKFNEDKNAWYFKNFFK